ncbi:MAG TPA: ABC transporter ATP-binding protein [Armatimonadota bacterium]|jgi:ABC-2 type transport system ATP-binding protein
MLKAIGLTKSFGETVAVRDVSFALERGEIFGLLGPNGAGKTTTIHMLTGVLKPDAGEVCLDGCPDSGRPEARRLQGLAPQALALYEHLTAEENLAFFGGLYGLSGARLKERVHWGLNFAGLTDRRHSRTHTFSGGMLRRLNLACALVHEPEILFLDEPTAGVDPQSRNHLFECIEALRAEGLTVLYTTHYMEEAERLCDRVAVMDEGRLLALDTVEGLLQRYGAESIVTAEFLGVPSNPAALGGSLEGCRLTLATDRPLEALPKLASAGVGLKSLHVERPTLESVFLKLTGRSLRD